MSGLNDAIEQLYSHFLLRDVLAKAIPGFLALLMLAAPLLGHHQERWLPFGRNLNWIAVLGVYGVSFLAGMIAAIPSSTNRPHSDPCLGQGGWKVGPASVCRQGSSLHARQYGKRDSPPSPRTLRNTQGDDR